MRTINSQCSPASAQNAGSGAAPPLSGIGPLVERQLPCSLLFLLNLLSTPRGPQLQSQAGQEHGQGQGTGRLAIKSLLRYYTPYYVPRSLIYHPLSSPPLRRPVFMFLYTSLGRYIPSPLLFLPPSLKSMPAQNTHPQQATTNLR